MKYVYFKHVNSDPNITQGHKAINTLKALMTSIFPQ